MDTSVFQRFQTSLTEKRQNLIGWLGQTQPAKKQIQLGTVDEQAIDAHLQVIGQTLEKISDHTLGICEVCHGEIETSLLEMDYTACVCLGDLSEQERRHLEADLELSAVVQRALLPQHAPTIPGFNLAAFSRPAQFIGGDYFDFLQFQDGAYGLIIADAMGHGISAGMVMSSFQTAMRTLVPEKVSPIEVLERINHIILHNINYLTFVTAFLCRFEPQTHGLTFSNAGQNPPLLYRKREGEVRWLKPTGAALGIIEGYSLKAETVTLFEGDILLFYTDGLTEAFNPQNEAFGKERLAELVCQNPDLSAQNLVRLVRQTVEDFTGGHPLEDDITLIAGRLENSPVA
jgi:sigma-B regulation protein RsbU (phosphoserine phosphatase)